MLRYIGIFTVLALTGCGSDTNVGQEEIVIDGDFTESLDGFTLGVADYRVDNENNDQISYGLDTLPSPYEYREGIKYSWVNYTLSLKGYMYKEVTGLVPNTPYKVLFEATILSNANEPCGAYVSSPTSVYVKAALLTTQPETIIESDAKYVVNFDDPQKGDDSAEGIASDTQYLGHVSVGSSCADDNPWESKTISSDSDYTMTTDDSGSAWLYYSIDSGYSGSNTYYFLSVEAKIRQQ